MLPVLFFQQFADVNVKIWHVLAIAIVVYILVKIKTAIGTKNLILLGGIIVSSLCLIFVDTDSQKATIDQKSIDLAKRFPDQLMLLRDGEHHDDEQSNEKVKHNTPF